MDALKNIVSNAASANSNANNGEGDKKEGGNEGGLMGIVNNVAGGGAQGEKNEDYLDKTIDFVQENVLKQGKQDNESAVEQAQDKMYATGIRTAFKNATGSNLP